MVKSYRVGWVGCVAHKILLSAPVPWIWDLGIGDWGPGLDNSEHKILRLLWVHSVVKMR